MYFFCFTLHKNPPFTNREADGRYFASRVFFSFCLFALVFLSALLIATEQKEEKKQRLPEAFYEHVYSASPGLPPFIVDHVNQQ